MASIRVTEIEVQSLQIEPDHVYLLVLVSPTEVPCDVVRQIKGLSAQRL
ncbi:transposase [Haladaptatus salinisoli]